MSDPPRSSPFEESDAVEVHGAYRLRVSPDNMRVLLDCPAVPSDIRVLLAQVRAELAEWAVPEEWLGDALEQRIRAQAGAPSFSDLVIVEGEPSEPPTDGRIEWGGDFFSFGFVIDEQTGTIDYRRHIAQTSVEEGQFLARIVPPNPGKNGRDIYGRMLPAEKGSWPVFRPGVNVREDKSDRSYYAAKSGRIRWDRSVLSVDEVYTIRGNVGLETGHISHPGALVIDGDIEPCSEVEARGDIEVRGVVEHADVSTGGNLYVRGGITGRGKRPIRVSGKVHARFINEAELEVEQDVAVEREILQSSLRTRGILAMPQGRLVGGETMALGGVQVGQTGSEVGIPTFVIAGEDYRLLQRFPPLQRELHEMETRRDRIRSNIEPLRSRQIRMSYEMRQAMDRLLLDLSITESRMREITTEIEQLKADAKSRARRRIEVVKRICPETVFILAGDRLRIREEILGPLYALPVRGEVQLRTGRLKWDTKRGVEQRAAREAEEEEGKAPGKDA